MYSIEERAAVTVGGVDSTCESNNLRIAGKTRSFRRRENDFSFFFLCLTSPTDDAARGGSFGKISPTTIRYEFLLAQ